VHLLLAKKQHIRESAAVAQRGTKTGEMLLVEALLRREQKLHAMPWL
jgi:hypothetical protein